MVELDCDEGLVGPEPRELLDAPHRLRPPGGGRLDDGETALDHFRVGQVLAHQLGVAEDGLEQVVEVVRDAARHLPEGGELLGLVHLRLELALGGHVAHDGEEPVDLALASRHSGQRHREGEHLAIGALGAEIEGGHGFLAGEGRARGPLVLLGEDAAQ